MNKNETESIRFLESIIDVCNIIKTKIQEGEGNITSDILNQIIAFDNQLDTLHYVLFEGE